MLRFVAGAIVGAILTATTSALAVVYAEVNTNGVLKGYIVQDKRGREVCRDPMVWNQFRGPESYINCR